MDKITKKHWLFILTLGSLTALGPLSIDMYLPAFPSIAKELNTDLNKVQISLSTFLAGLAIGQLFWGPISDRFGCKKPIIISMCIFIVTSLACLYITDIKAMWALRFLQAFGSSGGVVIARALVNQRFDKDQTLRIFSILAVVGGIAPIIAPLLGNTILSLFAWQHVFTAMAICACMSIIMTSLFLKETPISQQKVNQVKSIKTIIKSYGKLFSNKTFITYTIIGSMSYSCLMLYISNSPVLVMDHGGLSPRSFTYIFMCNSLGLMFGSFITSSILRKKLTPKNIITFACIIQITAAFALWALIEIEMGIYYEIIPLFFFVMPLGMLFPTTTTLALSEFKNESGVASALFGSSQLAFTFMSSLALNSLNNGAMNVVAICLFLCATVNLSVNLVATKKK